MIYKVLHRKKGDMGLVSDENWDDEQLIIYVCAGQKYYENHAGILL